MKTLIIYYTFGGATREEAKRLAAERGDATLCEVKEVRKRGILSSFFDGAPKAMKHKASEIQPISAKFTDYDRIVIGAPIWADFPAPAWNAIVALLPKGKEVELFFCSGGGKAEKSMQSNKDMIAAKGCKLIDYRDVKTSRGIVKEK